MVTVNYTDRQDFGQPNHDKSKCNIIAAKHFKNQDVWEVMLPDELGSANENHRIHIQIVVFISETYTIFHTHNQVHVLCTNSHISHHVPSE